MSTRDEFQRKRLLYAYHEAGHAVVWHLVNGLVEAVSIDADQAGYKGYCRFGFLLHTEDDPVESDVAWTNSGRINPNTVTAYYAGVLAMALYCAFYGGEDDYVEGSEQDDLAKINELLLLYWLLGSSVQKQALRDGEGSSSPACKHRRVGVQSDIVDSILMLERRSSYTMEQLLLWRVF